MEIKTKEIKLPKSINDLRIRHIAALTDESFKPDNITLNSMCIFVSNVTLININEVRRFDLDDLKKIFFHFMEMFNGYSVTGKPRKEIEVNGKLYELVDPNKAPIGYHIDCEGSDFEKDPVRLACINYIPKGTNYGDLDQNKNMIHPIAERYEDFKQHFQMTDYLELNGFFLLRYFRLINKFMEKQKVINQLKKIRGLGRK